MNHKVISLLLIMLFSFSASAGETDGVLNQLSQRQGFFFFYSASCPHCQSFAPTLKQLSERFGFKVVAISIDGGFLPAFPDAMMDEGQKQRFQVSVLPTLFLVNPSNEVAQLVTEGAIDEAELIRRLITLSRLNKDKGLA